MTGCSGGCQSFRVVLGGSCATIELMFPVHDASEVSTLRERLRAVVSALDVDCCVPSEAERLVREGEEIERLGHAIKTLAAARVVAAGTWEQPGVNSPAEWLAGTTGTSKRDAQDTLDTARKLKELPATAEAVRAGRLSAKQAKTVADAAQANPAAEDDLLDTAQHQPLGALKDRARKAKAAADKDPEATRRRIHASRSFRTWTDGDGVGHLHATGTPDEIGRLGARVAHRASEHFARGRRAKHRETLDAYAFDALSELVLEDGSGTAMPAGADAKIIVRVDHAALMRGWAVDGETCEIAGIGPVPVSVAREWMDDAFVAAILTKGEDITKVVHLGRQFTARQKTALQWRDPECCVEGCTNTRRLEYDHDTGWADTKTTCVDDADRMCHEHHRKKSSGWHLTAADANGKRRLLPPGGLDDELVAAVRAAQQARRAKVQTKAQAQADANASRRSIEQLHLSAT
jgi:hypothetical protein